MMEEISRRNFWEFTGFGFVFLIMILICGLGFFAHFANVSIIIGNGRAAHDFLLGLADKPKQVKYIPKAGKAGLKVRKLLQKKLSQQERLKLIREISEFTPNAMTAPFDPLEKVLRNEKYEEEVMKALNGELDPDELDMTTHIPLFPLWAILVVWGAISIPVGFIYTYECAEREIGSWKFPWRKAWSYPAFLSVLPGVTIYMVIGLGLVIVDSVIGGIKGIIQEDSEENQSERREESTEDNGRWENREEPTTTQRENSSRRSTPWILVDLDREQELKEVLQEKDISFTELTVEQPRSVAGIAFPEIELTSVLEELDIEDSDVVNRGRHSTERDNVSLLSIKTKAELLEEQRKRFEENEERFKERYVEHCKGNLKKEISKKKDRIDTLRAKIEEAQRKLVEKRREIETERPQLEKLEEVMKSDEASKERFEKEFDKIRELSSVRTLEVTEANQLKAYTEPMEIEYKGDRYEIGIFEIVVSFDGTVRLNNLTHRVEGHDHPHVSRGDPCLGNIGTSLSKLIADYDYYGAMQLLITFLESVHPDGWFQDVREWPEVR